MENQSPAFCGATKRHHYIDFKQRYFVYISREKSRKFFLLKLKEKK